MKTRYTMKVDDRFFSDKITFISHVMVLGKAGKWVASIVVTAPSFAKFMHLNNARGHRYLR